MMIGMSWGMAIVGLFVIAFLTLGIVANYLMSARAEPPK
jgi:hypothetical protein